MLTRFIAISERDRSEYLSRYNQAITGVIGICYSRTDLAACLMRDQTCPINVILHLGSLDIRKTHGIKSFIQEVWPELKGKHKELSLVLGGKNSQLWDNPALGIHGLGPIEKEQEFMDQGLVFINPQEVGTGVNLKSLTAMKYGRVLISTTKGLEGIEGESGVHFLSADSLFEMGKLILEVVENSSAMSNFSSNSRRAY